MEALINGFIDYLHNVKNTSENTILSYRRDLKKWQGYMEGLGLATIVEIKEEHLQHFVQHLSQENFKAATISRNIASHGWMLNWLFSEVLSISGHGGHVLH